ncbi:MAG: alpha/beta hydrolase [Candidatus Saelkia tenebricola]|nr:alpha/beta hydrolase [Candidatus Saelkia tenebricola]
MAIKLLVYAGITFVFFIGYMKHLESRSIFFPAKEIELSPKDINLSFENINIRTPDAIGIHGWFIPHDEAEYTVLFFHGNGGNIGHRLDKIMLLNRLKLNLFLIDYRGYGKSQGRSTEQGVYIDAQAAYDYLINTINVTPDQIILYGESLGAAVAIELALKVEIKALITEGAFSSVKDIAKKIYPLMSRFLITNKFDSINKIDKINVPKLFIHARDDNTVPFELGKRLYDKAHEPKNLVQLTGGHDEAFLDSRDKYVDFISSFINSF